MDSPQSVVSPFKGSHVFVEHEKQNANVALVNSRFLTREINFQGKEASMYNLDEVVGVLEVYIHEARDIHNICIYQKQDVYAKLCLTNDPEDTVSTKIINGGGRNPVFNENLRLNVRKVDSSIKCEIWMLSRVRNYLEDQLLGFALVPVSDILLHDGKLKKEFSLSSTDLFHSPAGFVQLSISFDGAPPEVIPLSAQPKSVVNDSCVHDTEYVESIPCDLEKIEFPDPKITNENNKMVEEYFAMPCTTLDSQNSDNLVSSDSENHVRSEVEIKNEHGNSLSVATASSRPNPKIRSPSSSVSANGSSNASLPASSRSSDPPKDSKSLNEENPLPPKDDSKEKSANNLRSESNATIEVSDDAFLKPVVTLNIEPENKVDQQEIVDMYMKSMQQFTESLAKMKLPVDFESGPTSSENSSSDQRTPASKNSGSRVFYGSRAFF
ncbi:uncharacterized protein LOC142526424 [Primulina tabacum]|uniref:uncharacterized protein LOC142526424 n=1 Tax=Primulina tabacum TaxID=48773 RepID=UPI003F5955D4